MTLWLVLSACWRPDPTLAPELPPLEPSALEAGDAEGDGTPTGDANPTAEGSPTGEGNAGDGTPTGDAPPTGDGAPDEPDDPGDDGHPVDPNFVAYTAYLATSPVTIVDDLGKPLVIVPKLGTAVEVRGEESIRKRVYCATCEPATEGWVQSVTVTARGEKPPRTAKLLPPGAPPPGLVPGG